MAFFYAAIAVLIILILPIFARADVYFDIYRGLLAVEVSTFGFSVARINVFEKEDCLVFSVNGKGEKKLKSNGGGGGYPFFKGVKIRKMRIVMRVGLNDAASTALFSAVLNNANFKNTTVTCIPDYNNKTSFSMNVFVYTFPVLGVIYGFKRIKAGV